MQNNFRCRMFVMYIVNAPKSINLMWSMIKGFLEEKTVKKIKILTQKIPEELFNHCNTEQIEVNYGGSSKNVQHCFWY